MLIFECFFFVVFKIGFKHTTFFSNIKKLFINIYQNYMLTLKIRLNVYFAGNEVKSSTYDKVSSLSDFNFG